MREVLLLCSYVASPTHSISILSLSSFLLPTSLFPPCLLLPLSFFPLPPPSPFPHSHSSFNKCPSNIHIEQSGKKLFGERALHNRAGHAQKSSAECSNYALALNYSCEYRIDVLI